MRAKEKVQEILSKFDLNCYANSCKGMTIVEFEKYTIKTIDEFEAAIKSFKEEDENELKNYVDRLSRIRVFYNKALNYVKFRDAKVNVSDEESKLLERLYINIKR